MRKPKRVARGFEILNLGDSYEDDFECLGSNPVNDASSTFTNSSSDDDWSIVDGDVYDGDVIYTTSTFHGDENGGDQAEARSTTQADFSKERIANLKKKDVGAQTNKITSADDWISLSKPATPDLPFEEVPINVDNFVPKNTSEDRDERSHLNELGLSDKTDFGDNFIFQNDSARELLLECVEFVGVERNGTENQDVGLEETFCSDDQNLFPSVEMSDSDSENGDGNSEAGEDSFKKEMFFPYVEIDVGLDESFCSDDQNLFPLVEMSDSDSENGDVNSEAGEDSFEKEMFFPYVEIPESEFACEEVTPKTEEGCEITHGAEAEPSDDHLMIEDQYSDDFFNSLYAPEDSWYDADTILEIKCNEPENFLPSNDLYDFFPTRHYPLKFDRYGSRHRKRQYRLIAADIRWRKTYYYY